MAGPQRGGKPPSASREDSGTASQSPDGRGNQYLAPASGLCEPSHTPGSGILFLGITLPGASHPHSQQNNRSKRLHSENKVDTVAYLPRLRTLSVSFRAICGVKVLLTPSIQVTTVTASLAQLQPGPRTHMPGPSLLPTCEHEVYHVTVEQPDD